MSKIYDIYGLRSGTLEDLSKIIDEILDISRELRDSDFRGIYFRYGSQADEEIVIENNYNDFDEEWNQPEFSEYPFILYINNTQYPLVIEDKLSNYFRGNIVLIKREEL